MQMSSCKKIKEYVKSKFDEAIGKWDIGRLIRDGIDITISENDLSLLLNSDGTGQLFSAAGILTNAQQDFKFSFDVDDTGINIVNDKTGEPMRFSIADLQPETMVLTNQGNKLYLKKDFNFSGGWLNSGQSGGGGATKKAIAKKMSFWDSNNPTKTNYEVVYTGGKLQSIGFNIDGNRFPLFKYKYTGDMITEIDGNMGKDIFVYASAQGNDEKRMTQHKSAESVMIGDPPISFTYEEDDVVIAHYPGGHRLRMKFKKGNLVHVVSISNTNYALLATIIEYDDNPAPFNGVTGLSKLIHAADYFLPTQLFLSCNQNNPVRIYNRSLDLGARGDKRFETYEDTTEDLIYSFQYIYGKEGAPTRIDKKIWDNGKLESVEYVTFEY